MEQENIQTNATKKLPILKQVAQTVEGSSTPHIPGPVTADENIQKKNDNMTFVSTPRTNNNDDVSTVFGVSTASPQVSTVNLSDATVYAFLANQPNGSQLIHEDLEQIHEDDLEEMDLKRTEPGIKKPQEGQLMWKTHLPKQWWQLMGLVLIRATWLKMKLPQTWPLWLFRLREFAELSAESYRVKPIEVVTQTSSVKISKPVKEDNDAPLIKD
nr:hypothetical protein [Tanacetum cinerariifolium]